MTQARFNPPPSWPIPRGWQPPAGWAPDPSWPPAPAGWQFWVHEPQQPGFAPPEKATRRGLSPQSQALLSAVLLVPTALAYYIPLGSGANWWVSWTAFLALDLYLLVIVAVWARTPSRRLSAAGLVIAATIVDRGVDYVNVQVLDGDYSLWLYRMSFTVMMLLFVAAWAVARRRTLFAAVGLAPTAMLTAAVLFVYSQTDLPWAVIWLLDVGVFALGCVCCWLIDLGSKKTAAPRISTV